MGLEANIVYLEEEIQNLQERIESIKSFLRDHPSVSIYRRNIKGRIYYYKKYRKGSKSVSEFLGKDDFNFKQASKIFKAGKEQIVKAKAQHAKLKKDIIALRKQLLIAKKAHKNARI